MEFACDSLREGVSQPDAVHAEVVDLPVPDVEAVEQVDVCREIVHDPVIDPVRIGILVPVAPGRTVGLQVARERRIGSRGVGRRPHLVHFGGVVLPGVGLRGVVEGRARHELSENEVARDRQVEILVVEPVVETSRHIRVAGTDVGQVAAHVLLRYIHRRTVFEIFRNSQSPGVAGFHAETDELLERDLLSVAPEHRNAVCVQPGGFDGEHGARRIALQRGAPAVVVDTHLFDLVGVVGDVDRGLPAEVSRADVHRVEREFDTFA